MNAKIVTTHLQQGLAAHAYVWHLYHVDHNLFAKCVCNSHCMSNSRLGGHAEVRHQVDASLDSNQRFLTHGVHDLETVHYRNV